MSSSSGWWSDFFAGAVAEFQQRMYPPQVTAADVELVTRLWGVEPGAAVLDVPCGDGRVLLEFAARGYQATGVDQTAEYLAVARRSADERKLSVELRKSDMRDLPWRDRFDAAVCIGNSFGYFDDAGNAELLAAVARSLRPGGVFVLQTHFAAESILANTVRRSWYALDDLVMLHDPAYNPARGEITTTYQFVRTGKSASSDGGDLARRTATYRVYLLRDLVALLAAAGFRDVQAFGATADQPFTAGCPTLHLRAVKA